MKKGAGRRMASRPLYFANDFFTCGTTAALTLIAPDERFPSAFELAARLAAGRPGIVTGQDDSPFSCFPTSSGLEGGHGPSRYRNAPVRSVLLIILGTLAGRAATFQTKAPIAASPKRSAARAYN